MPAFRFTGHTEYLAELTGTPLPVMLLASAELRVALATTHLPLRDVPAALTTDGIVAVIDVLHGDLRSKFGIEAPRIVVCGLNPHAGEGGHLGTEDDENHCAGNRCLPRERLRRARTAACRHRVYARRRPGRRRFGDVSRPGSAGYQVCGLWSRDQCDTRLADYPNVGRSRGQPSTWPGKALLIPVACMPRSGWQARSPRHDTSASQTVRPALPGRPFGHRAYRVRSRPARR